MYLGEVTLRVIGSEGLVIFCLIWSFFVRGVYFCRVVEL